ncbi:hypothetical protein QYE76_008262 [Lolium multiflorum]|uniref:Uncharacterized protein n=1 Tax=Lolium multiflorum TaxID=4521 RepID=A0AAD8Q3W1_LOLMU|nr:hypothetical protein QYE76_008262 [Lolium multiflorum]
MSERKSVLLATKSEWREVKDNPSTTIHYVLICKGLSSETNDLTNIPSSLLSLLKEFQDVFPDELPHGLPPLRGIEHRIDLIPGAPLPNRAAYRTNPEDTKEIQRQIQDLLAKGYVEHQDHGEDVTPWSREGEEQLIEKMYTELDPKSPEERKEEETDGRSRTRSDRAADRATRLSPVDRPPDRAARITTGLPTGAIRTTSRGLGTSSGRRPVTGPVRTGPPGHRPGLTGSLTGRPVTDPV